MAKKTPKRVTFGKREVTPHGIIYRVFMDGAQFGVIKADKVWFGYIYWAVLNFKINGLAYHLTLNQCTRVLWMKNDIESFMDRFRRTRR